MPASLLYEVHENILKKLENDELVEKRYFDGFYIYELGIDPGYKTWNPTVRRHIDELFVCNLNIHVIATCDFSRCFSIHSFALAARTSRLAARSIII